jgi:methylase of polypeptide subunit release factors
VPSELLGGLLLQVCLLFCIGMLMLILYSDIDDKSLRFARRNVEINGLDDRIHVLQTQTNGTMVPLNTIKTAR